MTRDLEEIARRIRHAAETYLRSMVRMVALWFDKQAYETCCADAYSLREALQHSPGMAGYTVRIMPAHDRLVAMLWRSSTQASQELARAITRLRDELAALVGQLRHAGATSDIP